MINCEANAQPIEGKLKERKKGRKREKERRVDSVRKIVVFESKEIIE